MPRWGSWLLITTWWQYWAAIRRACDRGTASYQEGGNAASDVAQNKVSVGGGLWWITVQHHNADNGTTLLCCLYVASHKIKAMHMHKKIHTAHQMTCCLMLVFHKLTVSPTVSLSPTHSHTRTHSPDKLRKTLRYQCSHGTLNACLCYSCVVIFFAGGKNQTKNIKCVFHRS